jgi:Tfp pilus assembly protein PilX
MLNSTRSPGHRGRQSGLVLVIALIVLVLLSLGALSLMRSVDTATLVAGNLAFQQSATRASDTGVEAAIAVLALKAVNPSDLNDNDPTNGYVATMRSTDSPAAGQSWQSFWQSNLNDSSFTMPVDQFGNTVQYVIHRLCANTLPPSSGGQCVSSPSTTVASGNSEEAGQIQLQGSSSRVYYRITVRVSGPRRTESYVQSHVSL